MIELGIVLVVGVGIVGFSAWTHTIDRRKELESTAVQREKIHTLAESVRFLREGLPTHELLKPNGYVPESQHKCVCSQELLHHGIGMRVTVGADGPETEFQQLGFQDEQG